MIIENICFLRKYKSTIPDKHKHLMVTEDTQISMLTEAWSIHINIDMKLQYLALSLIFGSTICDDVITRQMYDSMAQLVGDPKYPDSWW